MGLHHAASLLQSDLAALQTRMSGAGVPIRARMSSVGVCAPPGAHTPTGIFVRYNADGEDYVFTLTGNAHRIGQIVRRAHAILRDALARDWSQGRPRVVLAWPDGSGGASHEEDHDEHDESAHTADVIHTADVPPPVSAGYDEQERNPGPRRDMERGLLHQHTFSIQRRPDGLWTACVCIPVPGGPLYLCATADEHAVAQAMHGELTDVSGGRSWTGNDTFRAACGEVARARAMDRLGQSMTSMRADPTVQSICGDLFGDIQKALNDPGTQAAFAATSQIPVAGPFAAMAYQGARGIMGLIRKTNDGDPKATQFVQAQVQKAKDGDPKAAKFVDILKAGQELQKKGPDYQFKKDAKVSMLEAENKMLRQKLAEYEKKWKEQPLDAADQFMAMWGGGDDFVGPDVVQGAGNVMGTAVVQASGDPRLARPIVSKYYRARLPIGSIVRECSPEVGALYNRPMRESSVASLRRDYLRGSALETADFQQPGRELIPGWGQRRSA